MLRFNPCVALLAAVLAAIVCQPASAVVVYSEDFEGATLPATILDSPINWISEPGDYGTILADIPITQGSSPLNDTKVADGPATSAGGASNSIAAAWKTIDSPTAGMVYTFTADTWFTNAGEGLRSDNTVGVISSDPSIGDGIGWTNDDGATIRGAHYGTADSEDFELFLDLTGIGGSDIGFGPGVGVDQAATVTIELDLINNVATGTIVDGTGTHTVSEAIANPSWALLIDRVMMIQRQLGVDVDNILVTNSAVIIYSEDFELIPGDADFDGNVGGDDAAILAVNWQTIGGATWEMGDFNGDFNVDDLDATIMAANWGVGTAAVPEPSTISLLLMLVALGLAMRRRRTYEGGAHMN